MSFWSDVGDAVYDQSRALMGGGLKGAWEYNSDQVKKAWDEVTNWATDRKKKEEEVKKKEEEAARLENERNARAQKALDEVPTSAKDTRGQIGSLSRKRGRASTLLTGPGGAGGTLGGAGSRKTLLGS